MPRGMVMVRRRARPLRLERRGAWLLRAGVVAAILAGFGVLPAAAQLKKGRALRPDQKTCLDCHKKEADAYAARPSRHAPVIKGNCEACHKRHGVVGVLRLVADDPELCLSCHTGEGQAALKGAKPGMAQAEGPLPPPHEFSHPPRDRLKCGACHDPHGSARPVLLKAAGAEACLTCHEAARFTGKSVHPVARDCLKCHVPHGTSEPGALRQKADTLCQSCHEGKSEGELRAHGGARPSGASCLSCHAPHASPAAGLMRAEVHAPLLDGCDACHAGEAADGKRPALAPAPELCLNCHDDPRLTPAGTDGKDWRVHQPAGEGNCLTCHAPHASDRKGMLLKPESVLCGGCHAEAEAAGRARVPHPPARSQCSACHVPHGGPPKLLKSRSPGLCAPCHATVPAELKKKQVHPPAAAGDCLTCHAPHGSDHEGLLADAPVKVCGACHDVAAKAATASHPHPPARDGRCTACHVPHAGDGEHLLVADLAAGCLGCHGEAAGGFAADRQHAPFAGGDCLVCHQPHGGSRPGLLALDPLPLCRSCHDPLSGEGPGAASHAPLARGQCLDCHGPHGGHPPALLRVKEARTLCLGCHIEEGRAAGSRDGVVHAPFRKDSCLTCHVPHASVEAGLLKQAPGALCSKCHDTTSSGMRTAHKGLVRPTSDCTACHAAHTADAENLILPALHAPFADGDCGTCHQGGAP